MSDPEPGDRQMTEEANEVRHWSFLEAFARIGYPMGAAGVLFFGMGGFAVEPVVLYGMMLAVVACLCWAAAGRMMLGLAAFVLLGVLFYIGNDPHGAIQSSVDSVLGPTYFGCCRP